MRWVHHSANITVRFWRKADITPGCYAAAGLNFSATPFMQ
jgi:hypothetical protein